MSSSVRIPMFLPSMLGASLLLLLFPCCTDALSPVILVPGDGGNQLEATLDKPSTVHYICDKKTDSFFTLWLNLELLLPIIIDCWVDNMRLVYDNVTRTTANSPGVTIRVPGFGNTTGVDWLDPSQISPSAYFANIIQMLESLGYQKNVNIRGAPFDFRKAPNEMSAYIESVVRLTEETWSAGGPVTFVCHSMGCPLASYLLGRQTQAWKQKHVRRLVSLAGAWAGSVKAIKTFAVGENLDIVVVSPMSLRSQQRTAPSLAYLMPSDLYWSPEEVLVATDRRNYTLGQMGAFFSDIGWPTGQDMYRDTLPSARAGLLHPGVEVHCLYGFNVTNTVQLLDYRGSRAFPDDPRLVYGDGDGTVNARSLQACRDWQGGEQPVHPVPFANVDHSSMLLNPGVLAYMRRLLSSS